RTDLDPARRIAGGRPRRRDARPGRGGHRRAARGRAAAVPRRAAGVPGDRDRRGGRAGADPAVGRGDRARLDRLTPLAWHGPVDRRRGSDAPQDPTVWHTAPMAAVIAATSSGVLMNGGMV